MAGPTTKVTRELPREVFSALRRSPEEFGREMRLVWVVLQHRGVKNADPSADADALVAAWLEQATRVRG